MSYFPRNSSGNGLKQSCTTSRTFEIEYRGENCSSEISKPSIVASGYFVAASRAHALYANKYKCVDQRESALRCACAYVGDANFLLSCGYFWVDQKASKFFQKKMVVIKPGNSRELAANRSQVRLYT